MFATERSAVFIDGDSDRPIGGAIAGPAPDKSLGETPVRDYSETEPLQLHAGRPVEGRR